VSDEWDRNGHFQLILAVEGCVKRKRGAVVGIAGSVADSRAMIRRFLAAECARVPFEERMGMRYQSSDFFVRFMAWGLVWTERYTHRLFAVELAKFLKRLTEIDALQRILKKHRGRKGVYYNVHWEKLQAHMELYRDKDDKLVCGAQESARSGEQEGLCGETSCVGVARAHRRETDPVVCGRRIEPCRV